MWTTCVCVRVCVHSIFKHYTLDVTLSHNAGYVEIILVFGQIKMKLILPVKYYL